MKSLGNAVHAHLEGNLPICMSLDLFMGDVEDLQGFGFFLEVGQRSLLPVC